MEIDTFLIFGLVRLGCYYNYFTEEVFEHLTVITRKLTVSNIEYHYDPQVDTTFGVKKFFYLESIITSSFK